MPAAKAATAPAPPQFDFDDISKRLRDIENDLNSRFLERPDVIQAILCSIIAGQHVIMYGPPGTAKTDLAEAITDHITGAKFGSWLLDKYMDKSEMQGQYDVQAYDQTGVWQRDITDTIGDCHIQFWDEVGKGGVSVANTLLTLMQGRKVKPGKHWVPAPVISVIGASNEYLDKDLGAFSDRFLVWVEVDYIVEPRNFLALIQSAVLNPGAQAAMAAVTTRPTITLEELQAVNAYVRTIPVPTGIADTILKLRSELKGDGVRPSDRRFKQAVSLLQAMAFLNGRKAVDDDDLLILEHVLWNVKEEKERVQRRVRSMTSEFSKKAQDFLDAIAGWEAEIEARKGRSAQERAQYGGEVQFKMQELLTELNSLIEKANRQGRSTARLESVKDAMRGLKLRVLTDCMGLPADRAAKKANADPDPV